MSAETFRAGLALRARALGRAVPAASTKHVVLHDEAVGIVVIGMAGERTGLWGVGFGKLRRGTPKIAQVGDARGDEEQVRLWKEMASVLAKCGDEPQIVVSNRHSARLLSESASRFLTYKPDDEVRWAAEVVWWACTRREIAGSHAALVLTDALGDHFAISHDGGPTDDLRVWLAWIGASGPDDLAVRLDRRLAEPADPKTALSFDEALFPKVQRTHEELKASRKAADAATSASERAAIARAARVRERNRAAAIKSALHPLLVSAWARLLQGSKVLRDDPRPPLQDLDRFCRADEEGWARELRRRAVGATMRRRDLPRAAVMGLAESEVALDLWVGALCYGDEMARAEALATGDAISGTVVDSTVGSMTVAVDSGPVRARVGDTMRFDAAEGTVKVTVVDVFDDGGKTAVVVEWNQLYAETRHSVVLWPAKPDYHRRYLGWLAHRLSEEHWALGNDTPEWESIHFDPEEGARRLAAVNALAKL